MADTYLNPGELKELERALIEASAQDEAEIISVDWQMLQMKAINFLHNFKNLEHAQEHAQLNNLKQLINNPESAGYIAMRGSIQAYYQKAKYLLAFEFDNYVNNFLGGLPKEAIYVIEDEKNGGVSTFKMPMSELAKHSDKDGRVNIAMSKLKQLFAVKKGLKAEERKSIEEGDDIDPTHVLKAQSAYKAVRARLDRYYEKRKENAASAEERSKMQKQGGILLWKLSHKWTMARVLNFGDVKEAYTAALLTKHNSPEDKLSRVDIGKPEYYSHALVATFFNYYLHNVDSQAAILGEDVMTENAQYGVKSKKAPLPSLNQYLETAKWVASHSGPFTAEDLQSFLEHTYNNSSVRNNIIGTLENIADKTVSQFLTEEEAAIVSSLTRGWGK